MDTDEGSDSLVLVSDEDAALAREMRADWLLDDSPGSLKLPQARLTKAAKKQTRRGVA